MLANKGEAEKRAERLNEMGRIKRTPEEKKEYHRKYRDQKGLCAVCGEPMQHVFNRDCCVDHCHKTNKVRGLIHWYCNILVGVLEAKPILMEQLLNYVNKHNTSCDSPNLQEKQL